MIDLCAACGLCCNGTLFDRVTLVDDDLPKLSTYPELILHERDGQACFDEPCPLHTGSQCRAYADRPASCARFRCPTLRAVEERALGELEGLRLIQEARALVDAVRQSLPHDPRKPLAVSTWVDPPEGLSAEARAAWVQAKAHLDRHFLPS